MAGYPGRVVVLPGDRDWAGADDADALERQADFLAASLGDDVFVLGDGLPGPVDMKLTKGLRLVALDTEWWLRDAADPPDGRGR